MHSADDNTGPRLLTPGLAWLVGGLVVVLALLVLLGVYDPELPDTTLPVTELVVSLAIWLGAVLGLAGGGAAATHGLLLLAARDKAEAEGLDEVRQPCPHPRERLIGRALAAGFGLVSGLVLIVLTLLEHAPSPALILVGSGLIVYGVIAAALSPLAVRAALPGARDRTRWTQQRAIGLQRRMPHLHLGLLILLALTAVGLQLTLLEWVVEDAAISFAYAKHLAAGEGLVTFPGGERVEGYSNPLWTFLLAAWYLVGVDGFTSNKIMAAVFAAISVPLTYGIAREARPHRTDATPLLAAAILAGSAQFAIWGAGGLENSLLNVLIAAAVWRALVEGRKGGIPWSAVLWLGVAITRPEGILYAAIGGFWSMVYRAHRERHHLAAAAQDPSRLGGAIWRAAWPTLAWLGMFFLPFGLYHAWRYNYFAWELPNTYYAKKANPGKAFEPFSWTKKGWKYLRDWAHHLGHGYLAPVYLIGVLGTRGARSVLGVALMLIVLVVLTDPSPSWLAPNASDPDWWVPTRVIVLFAAGVIPAFAAIGRPGWKALSLCTSLAVAAMFFAVYAGGDWMNGFRWMSSFALPGSVLLAVGIAELVDRVRGLDQASWLAGSVLAGALSLIALVGALMLWLPPTSELYGLGKVGGRDVTPWIVLGVAIAAAASIAIGLQGQRWRSAALRWGPLAWASMFVLLGVTTVPNITRLDRFLSRPTTSPWSVKRRVDYMNGVQERLHMDERPTNLDVDMGATMYWSGDRLVDIAGLVDVPMGHHWFDRAFIAQYIFEEQRPHFAHVHGGWANTSRLKTHSTWKEQYLEIPPYPVGRKTHPGNHIRKDLIVRPQAPGPAGRATRFVDGLVLAGWHTPAGAAAPDHHLYLELAWTTPRERVRGEDLRVTAFIVDEQGRVAHSWDVPPGFDYYRPHDWKPGEIVEGRHSLPVPADLPLGTYDLGFAVFTDPRGEVIAAEASADEPPGSTAAPIGAVLDPEQARLVRGEVRWPGAVQIVPADQVHTAATNDVQAALDASERGDCEQAEQHWRLATRRTTRTELLAADEAGVHRALATCFAKRAAGQTERDKAVADFKESVRWDHHAPALIEGRRPLVAELLADGESARNAGDWPGAYDAFRAAVWVDPSQSWAQRWAIEALDCKLRIRLDQHDCGLDDPAVPASRVPVLDDPEASPLDGEPGRGLGGVPAPRTRPALPPSLRTPDTDTAELSEATDIP